MKRLIIILSIFTGLIGVINGQAITKDLKVKIDGFELEVLNSKIQLIIFQTLSRKTNSIKFQLVRNPY